MIDNEHYWIFKAISIIILAFMSYRVYMLFVSSKNLNKMIQDHYKSKKLRIENVSKLNATEKIKYGAPPFEVFKIYHYYFGIFTGKIGYTRKIEVMDSDDNEMTKYIELEIRNKKMTGLNEFDSYNV